MTSSSRPLIYLYDLIQGSNSWKTICRSIKRHLIIGRLRPEYFEAFITKYPECLDDPSIILESDNAAFVVGCLKRGMIITSRDAILQIGKCTLDIWRIIEHYVTEDDIGRNTHMWLGNSSIALYIAKKYKQYATLSSIEKYCTPIVICQMIGELGIVVSKELPGQLSGKVHYPRTEES